MGPAGVDGLLAHALAADPARPLLTFYDDGTGERAELSVTTFATWVAKTANLLRDDLDAQPGATVALDLPVHWQAAVWLQAAWALGLHVVPAGSTQPGSAEPDILVIGYDGTPPAGSGPGDVVALGLGPLGLARRDATAPPGVTLDYDREIAGHGDRFVPNSPGPDPSAPALTTAGRTHSGAALVTAARVAGAGLVPGARLLVAEPLTSSRAVLAALLVPLATQVTAVLCRHLDPTRLPDRARQEGLVAAVGEVGAAEVTSLPAWNPADPPG